MTKINLFMNNLFLLIAIIFCAISQCSSAISNKRLCYDSKCSEPVSLGRTSIRYTPNEEGLLPFDINVQVKVYSKEAGSRSDLWGVEINGKRGYVPKTFIKEYKILHKNLRYEVPTNQTLSDVNTSIDKRQQPKEENNLERVTETTESPKLSDDAPEIKSEGEKLPHDLNGVSPPYDVIDGTTFYLEQNEPVQPSPVTETIQVTAVPNKQDIADVGSDASNAPEKDERSIFAKNDELPHEATEVSEEQKAQDHSHQFNMRSFLASSEEVTDFPAIAGITTDTPSFNVHTVLKRSLHAETQEKVESSFNKDDALTRQEEHKSKESGEVTSDLPVDSEDKSNAKDAQPLDAVTPSSTETSALDDTKKINDTEVEETVPSIETDSVSTAASESQETSEKEVSNSEPAEGTVDNEKERAEYVTEVESGVESNTQSTKEQVADDIELKKEQTPEIDSTESSSKEHVENVIIEQDVKSTDELTAAPNNVTTEEVKEEEIVPKSDTTEEKSESELPENKTVTPDTENKSEESQSADASTVAEAEIVPKPDTTEEKSENVLTESKTVTSDTENKLEESQSPDTSTVAEAEIVPKPDTAEEKSENVLTESKTVTSDATNKLEESQPHDTSTVTEAEIVPDTDTLSLPSASYNESSSSIENENITSVLDTENTGEELQKDVVEEVQPQVQGDTAEIETNTGEAAIIGDSLERSTVLNVAESNETTVNINVNSQEDVANETSSAEVPIEPGKFPQYSKEEFDQNTSEKFLSSHENVISEPISHFNEFRNRNLLNVETTNKREIDEIVKGENDHVEDKTLPEYGGDISNEDKVSQESSNVVESVDVEKTTVENILHEVQVSSPDVCTTDDECVNGDNIDNQRYVHAEEMSQIEEIAIMNSTKADHSYWLTLTYVSVTAVTALLFSLGYYYIENKRRDGHLIAKINKLEKDLLVSVKECTMLNETLKITKDKLTCIEDESFGSNEMVLSLKADLEASQTVKAELEDQVAMLEKDLESATEAGLELERMLREVLSSNNEVNPLAQSVEDLQARLNAQQAANESLTNALNLKTQENEALSADLATLKKKYEELEVELTQVSGKLKDEMDRKNNIEQTLTDKVQRLEMQIKEISTEKTALQKELKFKEVELKDLVEVINLMNSNNLELDKLYDVLHIKAEATALREERNELKIRLSDVEGAHSLLEEHMKVVNEEIASLSEQCKVAEKEKKDAETRLEVLSNFFKEKEAERQKEEAVWLQKQGEVVSTVERLQTMQNEIQNYKQQIEILKREILDQEREYKNQISLLETKAHEQWVVARQIERRLEESKAEAGQLRNRLTLIEKNLNDADADVKLHRLEANGETATSPPLFIGADSSSSPIMFTGSSGVPPPPPPSYLFAPYLPPPLPSASGVPPYEVGQRPPPLGGRLSSPPPMPLHPPASSRYDNAGSPPPPMSPHMLPPFNHHRSPPPPPFGSDHIHPPPPPPGCILPPPLGTTHSWGEESLPPLRNSGYHPHQREQRVRNHKGSLHSSGESLDKTHHSSKV